MTKKPTPKPDPDSKPKPELDPNPKESPADSPVVDAEAFREWQRNDARRHFTGLALQGLLARNADPSGIARQAADLGEALAVEVEKRGWLQR